MIALSETFGGTFPFEPHVSQAPGFRMHYVDEGQGEPIVCLHGEPTWGYLYRRFVRPLSREHRVLVPDHMGFGKSETPQDREYTLRTHVENLTAWIDELGLEDLSFVLQDWGGPIGAAYTLQHPERVKRLFLMNTTLGLPVPGTESLVATLMGSRWFQWIQRAVADGSLEEVLGNLGTSVLSVMKLIGFENLRAVDSHWIDAYSAPFPTREECRGAIAFPLDVVSGKAVEYLASLAMDTSALRALPAMLLEGMQDQAIPPPVAIQGFRALFPKAPVVEIEAAGHFLQEDAPETAVAAIQQFLALT